MSDVDLTVHQRCATQVFTCFSFPLVNHGESTFRILFHFSSVTALTESFNGPIRANSYTEIQKSLPISLKQNKWDSDRRKVLTWHITSWSQCCLACWITPALFFCKSASVVLLNLGGIQWLVTSLNFSFLTSYVLGYQRGDRAVGINGYMSFLGLQWAAQKAGNLSVFPWHGSCGHIGFGSLLSRVPRSRETFWCACCLMMIVLRLYKLLVRPYLENKVQFWSPCYRMDVMKLKRVQRRFRRKFPALYTL